MIDTEDVMRLTPSQAMKILRWVLFLPGSFVASLIGAFLAYYAGAVFGDTAAQTSAAFLDLDRFGEA